jgi:hypothetical protein
MDKDLAGWRIEIHFDLNFWVGSIKNNIDRE